MNDLWLFLRLLDIALYCGVISGYVMRWRTWNNPETPGLRWGWLGLLCSLTYGVIELLARQQPGGPRLIPLTLSLGVVFYAFYRYPVQNWLVKVRDRIRPDA